MCVCNATIAHSYATLESQWKQGFINPWW
jgi:hypothetical protein